MCEGISNDLLSRDNFRLLEEAMAHCPPAVRRLELFEEAQVVFEEQADVVDAVFQHGDALYAEAECEPGPFFCIVIDEFEYCRVDHACSKNFYPACL